MFVVLYILPSAVSAYATVTVIGEKMASSIADEIYSVLLSRYEHCLTPSNVTFAAGHVIQTETVVK